MLSHRRNFLPRLLQQELWAPWVLYADTHPEKIFCMISKLSKYHLCPEKFNIHWGQYTSPLIPFGIVALGIKWRFNWYQNSSGTALVKLLLSWRQALDNTRSQDLCETSTLLHNLSHSWWWWWWHFLLFCVLIYQTHGDDDSLKDRLPTWDQRAGEPCRDWHWMSKVFSLYQFFSPGIS